MSVKKTTVHSDNAVLTMKMFRAIFVNAGAKMGAGAASVIGCPVCRGLGFHVAVLFADSRLVLKCSTCSMDQPGGTLSIKVAEGDVDLEVGT